MKNIKNFFTQLRIQLKRTKKEPTLKMQTTNLGQRNKEFHVNLKCSSKIQYNNHLLNFRNNSFFFPNLRCVSQTSCIKYTLKKKKKKWMREGPNFFFFFDLWIISRVKYIQGTIINKNEENRSGRKSRLSLSLSRAFVSFEIRL